MGGEESRESRRSRGAPVLVRAAGDTKGPNLIQYVFCGARARRDSAAVAVLLAGLIALPSAAENSTARVCRNARTIGRVARALLFSAIAIFLGGGPQASQAADAALEITVVPRIGAFNHLAFKIVPGLGQFRATPGLDDSDAALLEPGWQSEMATWGDYLGRVEPVLAGNFRKASPFASTVPGFSEKWDIITTSRVRAGYGARRVWLRVPTAPPTAMCTFSVGAILGTPDVPCRDGLWFLLESNRAATARATVTDPVSVPQILQAEIPEDFLIVALGDSFMSGQGNPDGRQRSVKQADCEALTDPQRSECLADLASNRSRALWIDERCQRSAWSLPIQAALKILTALPAKHGAVTVVSFACSGAEVGAGLNSVYTGQLTFADFRDRMKSTRWSNYAKSAIASSSMVPSQLAAVENLLKDQPEPRKTNIDLLLLDGGGNDTGFASFVTDVVRQRLDAEAAKDYAAGLQQRFRDLQNAYSTLAGGIKAVDASQIVVLSYPDPTRVNQTTGCGGSPFDNVPLKMLAPFLGLAEAKFRNAGPEDIRISDAEALFAGNSVLDKLNEEVAHFAASVDGKYFDGQKSLLQGRGWCAKKTSSDPFGESKRWIRALDESQDIQGDGHGAMHPTWRYHAEAAKMVADFAVAALSDEPSVTFRPAGSSGGAASEWIAPPIVVDVVGPSVYQVSCNAANCAETPQHGVFSIGEGGQAPATFLVRDTASHHRWIKPTGFARTKVDATSPSISCKVVEGGQEQDCAGQTLSGKSQLKVKAVDHESGIADLRAQSGDWSADTPGPDVVLTEYQLPLKNGPIEIRAVARDKVDNKTEQVYHFTLDNVAPVVTGAKNASGFELPKQPLFALRNDPPTYVFEVQDGTTGPCQLNAGISAGGAWTFVDPPSECDKAAPTPMLNAKSYKVSFQFAYTESKDIELVQFGAFPRDYAGNVRTESSYQLFVLPPRPCQSSCVVSADEWKSAANAADSQRILDAAKRFQFGVTEKVPMPSLSGNADEVLRAAAWLNFFSSRYGSIATTGGQVLAAGCQLVSGTGDAYTSLLNLAECQGSALESSLKALHFIP
jgi:hypothetical protein